MPRIDLSLLPAHVALIMDGNGRWALQQGLRRPDGHREGSEAVRRTVRACRRLGIDALTLYAFSEQNWDRPRFEVDALMHLLHDFLLSERDELLRRRIRLRVVGRAHQLPEFVRAVLEPLVQDTKYFDGLTLTLALSYGGREEIADATREIARQAATGKLDPEQVDDRFLSAVLPSMEVGPVDLLIRTGGEVRISNFLLWGAAYAELYFSPTLWPDFREIDLIQAISAYQHRERRFGRVNTVPESASRDARPCPPPHVHV